MLKLSPALVCVCVCVCALACGFAGAGHLQFSLSRGGVLCVCEVRCGGGGGALWQELFLDLESGGNTR